MGKLIQIFDQLRSSTINSTKKTFWELFFRHSIQNLNILDNCDYAYNVETYLKLIDNNSGYNYTLINVPNQTSSIIFTGTLMNGIIIIDIDGIAHSGNHIHSSDISREF